MKNVKTYEKNETSGLVFSYLGQTLVTVLYYIIAVLISGLVLSQLWAWFVSPIFGIHTITLYQAYGLDIFISFFTIGISFTIQMYSGKVLSTQEMWIYRIVTSLVTPLSLLLSGWLFRVVFGIT